jgi:hypothetical protein
MLRRVAGLTLRSRRCELHSAGEHLAVNLRVKALKGIGSLREAR